MYLNSHVSEIKAIFNKDNPMFMNNQIHLCIFSVVRLRSVMMIEDKCNHMCLSTKQIKNTLKWSEITIDKIIHGKCNQIIARTSRKFNEISASE